MRNAYKKTITGILVVIFLLTSVFLFPPRSTVEAIPVVEVGANLFVNTARTTKELGGLDFAAYVLMKFIIREITADIVDWINTGFEGDPAFVTNPRDLILDTANEATGILIHEVGFSQLCEPFKPQILIALAQTQPYNIRTQCTLLDVVDNIEAFYDDFSEGGWAGWIRMTQFPQNNPYGAYLLTVEEQNRRINLAEKIKGKEVSQNKGFGSYYNCVELDPDKNNWGTAVSEFEYTGPYYDGGVTGCIRAEVQTPGSVIEEGAVNVFGSGIRQLELADEFNEIVNALVGYLITEIIGDRGLRGVDSSYTDSVRNDINDQESTLLKRITLQGIDTIIATETSYLNAKYESLALLENAEDVLLQLQACYEGKLLLPDLTTDEIAFADSEISYAFTTRASLNAQFSKANIFADITEAEALLAQITELRARVANATTLSELRDAVAEYQELTAYGFSPFHDTTDVKNANAEQQAIEEEAAGIINDATARLAYCEGFPDNYRDAEN